jgi:hypothetical protein
MVLTAAALALAGCGERAQTPDAGRKNADAPAWTTSDSAMPAFSAPGFKAGDKVAWEEQLRKRSQGQNDYLR